MSRWVAIVLAEGLTAPQRRQVAVLLLALVVFAATFAILERRSGRRKKARPKSEAPRVIEEPKAPTPRIHIPPSVSAPRQAPERAAPDPGTPFDAPYLGGAPAMVHRTSGSEQAAPAVSSAPLDFAAAQPDLVAAPPMAPPPPHADRPVDPPHGADPGQLGIVIPEMLAFPQQAPDPPDRFELDDLPPP